MAGAEDRSRARWSRAAALVREQGRALRLPELDGALLLGVGFAAAPGRAQGRGEREARVGVIEQRVGSGGKLDRLARELDRRDVLAAPRQCLGAHAAPGDRSLEVVAGQHLALVRERFGLGVAFLREQSARKQRATPRRVDAETEIAKSLVGAAQLALGGDCVALRAARRGRQRRRPRAGAA